MPSSAFRVSGFGFRVSGSGSRVQDFRFRISGSRIRGLGCRVFGFEEDLQIVVFEVDLDQLVQLHDVCARGKGLGFRIGGVDDGCSRVKDLGFKV